MWFLCCVEGARVLSTRHVFCWRLCGTRMLGIQLLDKARAGMGWRAGPIASGRLARRKATECVRATYSDEPGWRSPWNAALECGWSEDCVDVNSVKACLGGRASRFIFHRDWPRGESSVATCLSTAKWRMISGFSCMMASSGNQDSGCKGCRWSGSDAEEMFAPRT